MYHVLYLLPSSPHHMSVRYHNPQPPRHRHIAVTTMTQYYTIKRSLEIIPAADPVVTKFFADRGLLRASDPILSRWSDERMYQKLFQRYKSVLFHFHPDQEGSGEAVPIHGAKKRGIL